MAIAATLRSLLTGTVVVGLVCGVSAVAATSASAATPHHAAVRPGVVTHAVAHTAIASIAPAVAPSADASLSGVTVTNATAVSALAPAFDAGTHDYQVIENDSASADVTPTTTQVGATVVVATGGVTDPLTSGVATAPLVRGRNDVTVTVTSSDHSASSVYRISIWRLAAPKPQIVSIANATSTVYGGTDMTLTLRYAQLPSQCSTIYFVGQQFPNNNPTPVFDPSTGLTRVAVNFPAAANYTPGPVDLDIEVACNYAGGGQVFADTNLKNAVTYTAGLHVDSVTVPATVTTGTPMVIHGFGNTEYSATFHWLTDANGTIEPLDDWDFSGNDNEIIYADYGYGDPFYATSGPRTLHVGYCPIDIQDSEDIDSTCTTVYQQTINWVAPTPTQLSFSPSSGPQAGGTVVRLRGRFIVSGSEDNPVIKVGGQTASYTTVSEASDNDENYELYTQGQDTVDVTVPPSATTGPVPISVTNDYGTTVAAGSFTYSAQPTITAISPSTVANSGGAVVTVTGTAFGTSGTPTVIISGLRSPFVTRVSATKLTAVVPASTGTTGPVNVTVSSPQGGGISSASSLTLANPSTLPTITSVSPTSGQATDPATVTGTGFGAAGTAGVSVDGQWALVTASSSTKITFQVPSTNTAGAKILVVGTVTGAVSKANGFTVVGQPGINTVTPTSIPSYATGSAAKITLDGAGFGSTGKVKVGSAAAVSYTATASGTHIAGVAVPTTAAGSLPIVVTPTGSTTPLQSSVFLTAPTFTYVGPDPDQAEYGPADLDTGLGGLVLPVPTTGATPMRVEGSGFGTSGTVTVGTTVTPTTSWADGVVTFLAPAHAVGTVAITVTPTHSTLAAAQAAGAQYVPVTVGNPVITQVASVQPYHDPRSNFDPINDATNLFTVTGSNLAGTSASATSVVVSNDASERFTVVPTSVTATSVTFAAPRSFTADGWKDVSVETNVGASYTQYGIYYINAGVQLTVDPQSGYCGRTPVSATGSVTYNPAVVTITNSGSLFGSGGTVSIDGVQVTPTSYVTGSVTISMANLASDLTQPWGGKSIIITPTDPNLPAQTVGFDCAETPTVTTTANGSTTALTVAAGTSYTMGYTTTGFIGSNPFVATAPSGYEYVTAADFGSTGFNANVHNGVPVGAGDYYVRVSVPRATYNAVPYYGFLAAPVHVTITGTPITITAVSNNGANFTYKGQLGDGTGGSSTDFHYTASSTTDPITGVTWEYRDSVCEGVNATIGWTDGLPSAVAHSSTACNGNGTTQSSWDVRVKTFQMSTTGTDRSIYYTATTPYTQVTITPRPVSIDTVRADKVYDGTTAATFGALTFTGAIDGDDLSLSNETTGTFLTASPGVNKPVTLSGPISLSGGAAGNYTLTNPSPTVVGTISKASAVLSLAASTTSVLLSQSTSVTITPTVSDSVSGQPVDNTAAPVVLSSQTPSICTISGTTVTATHAGACIIAGTEAASTDYNAATAASDPTSTTETLTIHVFPAPQTIQVVADDLTVAVGDSIDPTSEFSGLFDGDSISNLSYAYYQGSTLLQAAPTTPGTYRIVVSGGTLTAANTAVYSNPTAFNYVASTLTITALPPTITTVSPALGTTTGGTLITVTGTLLDTVRSVTIGAVTLHTGQFTVNQAGTSLTFLSPAVSQAGAVDLTLTAGAATAGYVYTYVAPTLHVPGAPLHEVLAGHDTSITVTFTPPVSNGGAPITSYQVSVDGGHTWRTVTTTAGAHGTRTATVSGLTNGQTYAVEVRAVNRVGAGPASAAGSVRPVLSARAPGAPTQVDAVGRDHRIAVRFTPPTSDGGARIRSYEISTDGGRTWHRAATTSGSHGTRTATVTGLSNGVHYRVEVRAVNSQGPGKGSAVHRVVPNTAALGTVRHYPSSEVAISKHPNRYHGKQVYTRALDTSHNGTWAHPIPKLGAHQLTVGEAATLSKSSLFEFNSAVLTKDGIAEVKNLAGHLRLAHGVTCEGYTDYAGKAGHEKTLSADRALAVCRGLNRYGAHVKIVTHGYGGERPVVMGGTPESRAANRRVVVLVTS